MVTRLCPECGSKRISVDCRVEVEINTGEISKYFIDGNETFICLDCGCIGGFNDLPIEDDGEEDSFE